MKPIPVYNVTEITMEEWALLPLNKRSSTMTTYIQKQFERARDLSAPTDTFVMKIRGPVGQTNWINITLEELAQIEAILERKA